MRLICLLRKGNLLAWVVARSTESKAGEFPEIYALLNVDLLEDVNTYAKFVDSVRKVIVCSNSFAKHPAYQRRSSLIVTMHKTLILAAEFIRVHQDAVKCAKEAEVPLTAQFRLAAEKIEKLEYEFAILKRSNVSAPTSMQLETVHQEVFHLNAKLSATQAILEAEENEVSCVTTVVKDLECVNSELRSACFAKDEEFVFMHAEVSHLKDVASKLKSKEIYL